MTGALNALRAGAVELLRAYGLQAVTAMEWTPAARWTQPVAAVSVSRVVCAPGGFQHYLGTRSEEDGTERELYGRGVDITLALDLYAPAGTGESACQEALGVMAEALACRGVGGLPALEVESGRVEFLTQERMYRLPVTCRCQGWLVAVADDTGFFTDIEVKGRRV